MQCVRWRTAATKLKPNQIRRGWRRPAVGNYGGEACFSGGRWWSPDRSAQERDYPVRAINCWRPRRRSNTSYYRRLISECQNRLWCETRPNAWMTEICMCSCITILVHIHPCMLCSHQLIRSLHFMYTYVSDGQILPISLIDTIELWVWFGP